MHTIKNQFIVLPGGEDIVDVCVGMLGKTSDINLFRETRHKFPKDKNLLAIKPTLEMMPLPRLIKNQKIQRFRNYKNKRINNYHHVESSLNI